MREKRSFIICDVIREDELICKPGQWCPHQLTKKCAITVINTHTKLEQERSTHLIRFFSPNNLIAPKNYPHMPAALLITNPTIIALTIQKNKTNFKNSKKPKYPKYVITKGTFATLLGLTHYQQSRRLNCPRPTV